MIRAVVAGAAGRMGERVIHMIHQAEDFVLSGAFEHPEHPKVGEDVGLVVGLGSQGIEIKASLKDVGEDCDVLIDFTTPESTLENLRLASRRGLPMVIGTTGFSKGQLEEAVGLAKEIRCVMAPNMSVGVNVMFKIAQEMAHVLGEDYDIEVLEVHHRFKKDAPSGTAVRLAEILAKARNQELDQVAVYQRKGIIGERRREEIGIQTWRAGDITGEHTVMFGGMGERLELTHRAHNRDNFARGAIRAARWVIHQSPGLYDMQDVLGLR
ncbi:MAG: 4-hydroxy-tetrahydrodipicolinate reductase [Deltaproteobacteria bacterium]|nr:4-hydroxy-tetrahydrodipicolinate reductase [Deltaproteobacteria bacterium]